MSRDIDLVTRESQLTPQQIARAIHEQLLNIVGPDVIEVLKKELDELDDEI